MSLPNPLFEASYERLFGGNVALGPETDAFFERFYDHFLQHEEVARLFERTDMRKQVQMLKRSMLHLVSFYVIDEPNAELARLAALHRSLRIGPALLDSWLDALRTTVRELDSQCDERTELAWCWALTPGITYMRLGMGAT